MCDWILPGPGRTGDGSAGVQSLRAVFCYINARQNGRLPCPGGMTPGAFAAGRARIRACDAASRPAGSARFALRHIRDGWVARIRSIGRERDRMDVRVGDILIMKKNHPCGGNRFLVLRSGMDFRIRCVGCGREVMVPRLKAEKNIKRIERPEP